MSATSTPVPEGERDELGRKLAQFFFEVGYGACFADAMVANDMVPPLKLTDAVIERAWSIANEAYEDPAEFDAKLALANAAPELLEALEKARLKLAYIYEVTDDTHCGNEARLTGNEIALVIAKARGQ